MKVIDEDTNETMWLSEHSIAAQIDNPRWNYTCPEEVKRKLLFKNLCISMVCLINCQNLNYVLCSLLLNNF